MKPRRCHSHIGYKGSSTAKELLRLGGGRGHVCNFSRILPSAMDALVADGLFAPIGRDGRGKMYYEITPKGLQKLHELTEKEPQP